MAHQPERCAGYGLPKAAEIGFFDELGHSRRGSRVVPLVAAFYSKPAQGPAMNNRAFFVLVAAVVAFVACVGLKSQQNPVVFRPVPADVASGQYDRVHMSVAAATTRNEQAARLCESEINMILAREFPEIERRGNRAAEEVASYGSCCTIIYRLAKEQLGWSSGTADYVEGEIRRRLKPALQACGQELDTALDHYELALKESTVTLATELAQLNPSQTSQSMDVTVDVRTSGDLDQALRNLGLSGGILTVSGAFDALAIMNTTIVRSMIRTVVELAASAFAAPAATAAGSAAVAAADGPLPFGDAIAVVGGLWTAYDIYATQRRFEREIKASLANALPEMKRKVHHQIIERIRGLQSDYQRAQDRIRNEMASNVTR